MDFIGLHSRIPDEVSLKHSLLCFTYVYIIYQLIYHKRPVLYICDILNFISIKANKVYFIY
jgi:hypothetical protein